ncbi:hypothetical protein CONCODRAFT_80234 [Conidiobolus coronatus NRRL 28638]|uniref:Hyaluronan/mRNA-binding protein domain-containing protein n=1 Tax=Conidiobolus coronatus (strain ATCC 28846 / CBS 209.66 / NRRL 28638) TaxID=796925 RepID=A0A137NX95_CONC2|nr:hypothetical protein CONCODRAFT_80234 [Conidiobolus coronatus NRRL 28638]|eukprot:KXN67269.1 hypothetical protein CONCODRAFT_80234 [Conidiobolus coronatus NRRL 28638]
MTRSKNSLQPNPAHEFDRRISRNGQADIRAIPKKSGGGNHNWGTMEDDINDYYANQDDEPLSSSLSSSLPSESKIQLVSRDEMEKRRQSPISE